MTTTDLGTVLHEHGRIGLRYVRDLAHAPEKVWRALTESEHMASWMACDMAGDRRQGGTIELRLWPAIVEQHGAEHAVLPGVITVWDRPHVFEWTWGDDILRWELTGIPAGTRLTFTTWFADPNTPVIDAAAGYHLWLDALGETLDAGTATPIAHRDPRPVERRYAEVTTAAP